MNKTIDRPSLAQVVRAMWDALSDWLRRESAGAARRRLGALIVALLVGAFGLRFVALPIFPDRYTGVAGEGCTYDARPFPLPNRLGTPEPAQATADLPQKLNLGVLNSGDCVWNDQVTLQREGAIRYNEPISVSVTTAARGEFFNTQIEIQAPSAGATVHEIVYRMVTPGPDGKPFGMPIVLTFVSRVGEAGSVRPATSLLSTDNLLKIVLLLMPALAGMWVAFDHAGRFVRDFYSLKDEAHGRAFVWSRVFGVGAGVTATAKAGRLECKPEHKAIEKIGGPGLLIVHSGTVVLIERGSRYARLAGPGLVPLDVFERVRAVIDARPLNRERKETAYTRDGIEVKTKTTVSFKLMKQKDGEQIARPVAQVKWWQLLKAWGLGWFGGKVMAPAPPPELPASPEAVRSIVYEALAFASGDTLSWENVVKTDIDEVIPEKMLDELWAPDSDRKPRQEMVEQIFKEKSDSFRKRGVELLDLSIGPLYATDQDVDEQRREHWQAYWSSRTGVTEAEGEAEALRRRQTARAEAQAELIQAIVQSFRMLTMSGAELPSREVALRMLEVIARTMKATLGEAAPLDASHKALLILKRLENIVGS